MASAAALAPSARTIVVIEDEATIAAAVAARLRSEGFSVEIAPDGPRASSGLIWVAILRKPM